MNNCPSCGSEIELFKNKWFCSNSLCDFISINHNLELQVKTSEEHFDFRNYPPAIAIVLHEYSKEKNPYIKLHRLCDSAELITRFFAIISISDLYSRELNFPESLKKLFVDTLERPTFPCLRSNVS